MHTSEQIDQIATALAKAQGEMQNPAKDSKNPHFKSKYADLSAGLNAVRPILSKNGIAVVQMTRMDGEVMMLDTRLAHSSGQWIESAYPVCRFPAKQQEAGSALTYSRRYSLFAMVGIAGEDDDGNEASETDTPAPPRRESPRAAPRPASTPFDEGPTESQRACQVAITNKFLAAPTAAALDAEWKPAVEQLNVVGVEKGSEIYNAIVATFRDCKLSLQDRNNHKDAAE
jgi:hypothetical protein